MVTSSFVVGRNFLGVNDDWLIAITVIIGWAFENQTLAPLPWQGLMASDN